MAQKNGEYKSTWSGRFRVEVEYSIGDAGIVYTVYCNITNAFDKERPFTLTYCGSDGTKKTKSYTGSAGLKKVQRKKLVTISVPNYKIAKAISITFNGSTSTVAANSIISNVKPHLPSIRVNQSSPTAWNITVSGTASVSQPVDKVYLQYTNYKNPTEGDWGNERYDTFTSSTGAYSSTFTVNVSEGEIYRFRARVSGSSTGTEIYSDWSVDSQTYSTAPSSGGNPDGEQSGDNYIITWTATLTDIDKGVVQGWYILRSVDGGSYTQYHTVYAVTGQTNYSWTDTTRVSGHSYNYKVQPFGSGGSSWDEGGSTGETKSRPEAPTKVSAYRTTGDNIQVIITGTSSVAETVYVERSIDGGTWTQVAEEDYPYTSFTESISTATTGIIYRVRYGNDVGYSSYTTSNTVEVKKVPLAPTLDAPANQAIRALDNTTITFTWVHRPQDGAPQTAAVFEYKVNSGSWTTVSLSTNAYYTLNIQGYSANDIITWRVKTKGYHADYSPYSEERTVLLKAKPTVVITSPTSTVSALPIILGYTYTDTSGTLAKLTIDVIKDNKVEKTYEDTTSRSTGSYTYSLVDFLFETQTQYTLRIETLSSSGLTATAKLGISVTYSAVSVEGALLPIVNYDTETGYASVFISRDIGETGTITPVSITNAYLYRVVDGERQSLGTVKEGYEIIDKYAPVNKDYNYELLMLLANNTASLVTVTASNPSDCSYVYYDDDKICKATWNPKLQTKLSRPERVEVRYSGREYAVSYDTKAREETASFTALLEGEELLQFIDMMNCGGTGIWKSSQGRCYDANFDFTFNRIEQQKNDIYNCSLSVSRIEGV